MNSIEFRVWDKKTEEIRDVMGYDYEKQEVKVCSVPSRKFKDGILHTIHALSRDLDDVVLLQCTGVRDILGVKLYEGEIISHTDHHINSKTVGPIYRKSGSLVFDVSVDEYTYTVPLFTLFQASTSGYNDTIEYIGNIYED